MKRFLIDLPITIAEGTQTYWVDAENEEDALTRHKAGKGGVYSDNCEVLGLGEPEIVGETVLDDYGDFPPDPVPNEQN